MKTTPIPKHVLDNRSNQLNPQHQEYYKSRGLDSVRAMQSAEQQQSVRPTVSKVATPAPVPGKSKK